MLSGVQGSAGRSTDGGSEGATGAGTQRAGQVLPGGRHSALMPQLPHRAVPSAPLWVGNAAKNLDPAP